MYKLTNSPNIIRTTDCASIPSDPNNTDYAAYVVWVAAGHTPEPADVPPAPTYRELRAAAYPPATDYLDSVVKQSPELLQKYISDCLAVKDKYPKPVQI